MAKIVNGVLVQEPKLAAEHSHSFCTYCAIAVSVLVAVLVIANFGLRGLFLIVIAFGAKKVFFDNTPSSTANINKVVVFKYQYDRSFS
jgi:hypothetical protein